MTGDPRLEEQERLRQRADELHRTHQGLRTQRADVAEAAAAVHDEAARVHVGLGAAAVLDPQDLRAHADADRAVAREERAALAAEHAAEAAADQASD